MSPIIYVTINYTRTRERTRTYTLAEFKGHIATPSATDTLSMLLQLNVLLGTSCSNPHSRQNWPHTLSKPNTISFPLAVATHNHCVVVLRDGEEEGGGRKGREEGGGRKGKGGRGREEGGGRKGEGRRGREEEERMRRGRKGGSGERRPGRVKERKEIGGRNRAREGR